MTTIRSGWTGSPIDINGQINPAEWSSAGVMPILPAGYLMVKNDSEFLYVALDLTGDNGNNVGTGDYFWFAVDVDGNRQISPYRDIQYGLYPGQPGKLGRQYCIGPSTWTTLLNEPSNSTVGFGFASSPNSVAAHRIWELRLDLKEMGIVYDSSSTTPQIIRFGLRVASTTPSFVYDFPTSYYTSNANYANMHEIILAKQGDSVYPPGTAGVVIGGIGNIPATAISATGRATTAPTYTPYVVDSAFGGVMHFKGNRVTLQNLWNQGARKYTVLHRFGTTDAFTALRQGWTNYHWNGSTYVLECFGADASNMYQLVNPYDDYSIDDLLLQWNSYGFPAGVYQFQVQFFTNTGVSINAPAQVLTLLLDNNAPEVKIKNVLHDGALVPPCGIVNLGVSDGIQATITAYDAEGSLSSFSLDAYFGAGQKQNLFSDKYANHINPSQTWQGVKDVVVPVAEWIPPTSCAYQLRLSAVQRTTNGYGYIGYVEDTCSVTLLVPSPTLVITPKFTIDNVLGM